MSEFSRILSCVKSGDASAADAADNLLSSYPWFTAARALKACASGRGDALTNLLRSNRSLSSLGRKNVDAQLLAKVTDGEIIDRFLHLDNYRIVADEGEVEDDIRTEAELDDEDDLVTEELAEVFIAQGLKSEAIEIYRKLSLRNTEKSVYFAEKIGKLTENN